jgi:hypothetical protein
VTPNERVLDAVSRLSSDQLTSWRDAHGQERPAPLRLDWSTIVEWTPEHRACVRAALHDWCCEQLDARDVLRALTQWNRRLGVWLTCQVARTTLHLVPADEHRPRIAIETAERWIRGEATAEECRRAADSAYAAYAAAYAYDAASAAYYAAYDAYAAANADNAAAAANAAAAYYAAYAAYDAYAAAANAAAANAAAANAAYAAATANANAYADVWKAARVRRLRELCVVCASAIHGALDAIEIYHSADRRAA